MRNTPVAQIDDDRRIEDLIMDTVADGTVLVGTLLTLSQALGVKVVELRYALRELLETRKIAVSAEAGGQLTVRLERRVADLQPHIPPAIERRRPKGDIWIL